MKQLFVALIMVLASACAKTGFSDGQSSGSSSVLSAAQAVAGQDGSSGVIVAGNHEPADDESGDENESEDQSDASSCADFFSGKVNASLSKPLVMQDSVTLNNVEGEVVIDAKTLSLENIRGPVLAETETATQLDNMRGLLCLQGLNLDNVTATAQLTNHRGHAEIQDLDLSLISDTRGSMIIHGGSVKSIQNHRGHLVLIDTVVGDIDDVRGEIELQGTSKITGTVTNSDPVQIK